MSMGASSDCRRLRTPTSLGTFVPHESLALFHRPVTVGFPEHFEHLRSICKQLHTKRLHNATLKTDLLFARRGCSRYLCAQRDPTSTTSHRRLKQVAFQSLDSHQLLHKKLWLASVAIYKKSLRELLGLTLYIMGHL
ncbi:hypothetical protein TNCV_1903491 [Trichonephila clavipes]|nr:hypothetical protein TNCV_1903491 [Trichonephila clavipes]